MKFQEALEKLRSGLTVSLETTTGTTIIAPHDPDQTVLGITIAEALSDQWHEVYTPDNYKKDMGILADVLARITASGISLKSNGEDLREIETVTSMPSVYNPGFISNYNGKWALK